MRSIICLGPVAPEVTRRIFSATQQEFSASTRRRLRGAKALPPLTGALRQWWSVGLLPLMLAGCAGADRSPTIEFSGSYFPAWMICIVCGLILTSLTRLLFVRLKLDAHLRPAPLVYFSLIAIFTFVTWLTFFNL